jgi:RNA polymerase sigma-70 factor (ECF subfamily)
MLGSPSEADDAVQEAWLRLNHSDAGAIENLGGLDRLAPAERIAFVLHDTFDVSFDEIASIIGRSPAAARQLASRARRRVKGVAAPPYSELNQQRQAVDTFLNALRRGDIEGLLAVLDPEVVVRIDEAAAGPGGPREIRGARTWAKGAVAFAQFAASVQTMLVDGTVGLVWTPGGHVSRVLRFAIENGKIVGADIIADPARLRQLHLTALGE